MTGLEVRPYRPGDETGILAFFPRAFGREAPPGFWAWKYGESPVEIQAIVALDGAGRVIAHMGGVPVWAQLQGHRITISQATDWGIDPDYRRGLRGGRLLARLTDRFVATYYGPDSPRAMLLGVPRPTALALIVSRPHLQTFMPITALIGEVPSSPAPRSWRHRIAEVALDDPAVDALWSRLAPQYALATVRDRAYLGWRYARCPFVTYRALGVVDRWRGRLEALAVLRLEWEGYPYSVVADWLAPRDRPDVGRLLLSGCEAAAQAAGRGQLLAWFPPGSPETQLVRGAGYGERPTPYTLICVLRSPLLSLDWLRAHWYYTAGDTDIV